MILFIWFIGVVFTEGFVREEKPLFLTTLSIFFAWPFILGDEVRNVLKRR